MSGKGRKPTPTAILKLRGSWRAKTREDEPLPKPHLRKVPEYVVENAKVKRAELLEDLGDCGLLTCVDADTLNRYCILWSRWLDLEVYLQEFASDQFSDNYDKAFKRWMGLSADLLKAECQMGMTPASRAKISIVPTEKKKDKPDLGSFKLG